MTTARRWALVIGATVVAVVLVLGVLLGVGRFPAFDIFGQDDPLGDPAAKIDLVACFQEGLDRFAPHEVASDVLSTPRGDGSFDLLPGVDGYSLDSTDGQRTDVLSVDFYSNSSDAEVDAVESALLDRSEITVVLRDSLRTGCSSIAAESTGTTG